MAVLISAESSHKRGVTSADPSNVGPPYFPAEMYDGRVACCPLLGRGEYTDGQTVIRTDAEPLHYAFHYVNVQCNEWYARQCTKLLT